MEVEGEVVALAPQPPRQREIVEQTRGAARPRDFDHPVEMRVVADDRRGRGFDQVVEPGVAESGAAARGWRAS